MFYIALHGVVLCLFIVEIFIFSGLQASTLRIYPPKACGGVGIYRKMKDFADRNRDEVEATLSIMSMSELEV